GFGRVRGRPRGGRTGAGSVGLGVGGADDGVAAGADPALAGVGLRAGIAVAAGAAIGLRRVRARPRGGRTGAGSVALVGGGADDGVAAGADPALAGVGLRARVAVVARRRVVHVLAAGCRIAAVVGAGVLVVAVGRRRRLDALMVHARHYAVADVPGTALAVLVVHAAVRDPLVNAARGR